MKVTLQKQEKNKVCLEVEVGAEQVSDTYEKRFREAIKNISVPGFRKGKAPRKIVEKYVYMDVLKQDVVEQLVSDSYGQALKDLDEPIEPISDPQIELVKFDLNEPFVFKATLEVKPEVKLPQYKGLDLEIDPLPEISDEDVEKELQELRKRHGEMVVVDDRAIENGDIATLDIYGEVEGEPIPEGTTDNLDMEIKADNFVPGFTEQLVGVKTSEEKTIEVVFPDNYPVVDLRNKQGKFKVFVKEIKSLKLPELNDDFIKQISEHFDSPVANTDELKAKIKAELIENRKVSQGNKNQQSLIQSIVEGTDVEVPESMLKRELYAMWSTGEGQLLQSRGVAEEVLMASWENWQSREDMIEEGNKRIKTTLVLSQIAKEEKIELTSDELNNHLALFAQAYRLPVEELRKQLIEGNRMIPIIDELLSVKILNWVRDNSKVKTKGEVEEVKEEAVSEVKAEEG